MNPRPDTISGEVGVISALHHGQATAVFDRHAACGKCHACGLMAENASKVQITLPAPAGAKVGDSVTMIMESGYFFGSLMLTYGLPCLMLIAGVVLGFLLWGEEGQTAAALLGLGMTAVSYCLLRIFDRRLSHWRRGRLKLILTDTMEDTHD